MLEYIGILFSFLIAGGVAALLMGLQVLLGPKAPNPVKERPFECGKEPFSLPHGQAPIKFYIIAMLFIIFDVELVFLFPWAVIFRRLGLLGLLEMAFFLGIVVLGFLYVWKKGALEWE